MTTDLAAAQNGVTKRELAYAQAIKLSVAITAVGMLLNILVNSSIGVIADIALVVSTIVVSLLVRPQDWLASVWAVPVSWFSALITIGQFASHSAGSFLVQQAFLIIYGLGAHAVWLTGCTVGSIVIHYVRMNRK
jgi:hypothetical protein